jgi:hypothetical protein
MNAFFHLAECNTLDDTQFQLFAFVLSFCAQVSGLTQEDGP